jgi:DNA-binding MarR family transcriptional regulator
MSIACSQKGLVSRVESTKDRRVRIVTLSARGKALIESAFRKLLYPNLEIPALATVISAQESNPAKEQNNECSHSAH